MSANIRSKICLKLLLRNLMFQQHFIRTLQRPSDCVSDKHDLYFGRITAVKTD